MTFETEPKGETPQEQEYPVVFTQLEHRWKDKGGTVVCTICPNTHGFDLPPGYHLTGLNDDGTPIVTRVW